MIVKNVEKKEHSTAMLQVEVDAEAFEKALNTAYRKEKNSIFVAGFRKGKAPRAIIEGMYGREVFHDGAVSEVAPEAFEFAVGESGINAVGMPGVVDYNIDDNGALTITFRTDVYPEATLGQYKGVEVEYNYSEVTDEDVDKQIEDTRRRNARLLDVERPVKQGDTVLFDFEGFVDGVPFEGGKSEGYSLEIGSGAFVPGFEDGMIGQQIGQPGEVKVTFPENYDPALAGKEAVFKVLVHSIKEPQYPELDDEFAKDVSEFDTLEEYKADVKKKMEAENLERAENEWKAAIVTAAAENLTADVPESMIDDKITEFLRGYAQSMGVPGISREELLKTFGTTEETIKKAVSPNAVMQIKGELLLDKIAETEKLEATEQEKADFYKKIEEDYGEDAEKVKGMIDDALVIRDLVRKKAAELIYAAGVKTQPKPAETDGEKPESEESAAAEDVSAEKKPAKKTAARKTTKKTAEPVEE